MSNFSDRGLKKSVDWTLVMIYLLLVLIGWVNIYASIHSDGPTSIFDYNFRSGKQFIWILTSIGLASVILFAINPQFWESSAVITYLGVGALLVAVIFLGIEVKGSRSWFEFGPIRFQPAEISKISTSLLLASVMSQHNFKISKIRDFILVAAIIGIPMLIILAESETGSALVYVGFIFVLYREGFSGWWIFAVIVAVVLFILTLTVSSFVSIAVLIGVLLFCNSYADGFDIKKAALRICLLVLVCFIPGIITKIGEAWPLMAEVKPLYVLIGACVCAIPVLGYLGLKNRKSIYSITIGALIVGICLVFSTEFIFNNVLQDHQRKRIEVLLGMKDDPSGVGYNVNQSMIAIGSGGLTGKGYLNGTQTSFGFVPEQSTDFIFCTVGEEWGFLGCLTVILLYVLLIGRIVIDAERCRSSFTRLYGYCVAACIFMHLFINVGMTIGLMPVIGIPLPLLSYGGSSLWAFTILIFIFVALYHQEKKYY